MLIGDYLLLFDKKVPKNHSKNLVHFLGDLKASKFPSEIN